MRSTRRKGVESSEVRAQLIEAASQLIQDEGFSAVTAGRLAERVGLKRHIVHYYFGTIEELFIAVIRRAGDEVRERMARIPESDEPLRMIWELANTATASVPEFTAIAIRRPAIQAEVSRYAAELRKFQTEALARHLELRGIEPAIPPVATVLVMAALSRSLAMEKAVGVSEGHPETTQLVENWLRTFLETGESFSGGSGATG